MSDDASVKALLEAIESDPLYVEALAKVPESERLTVRHVLDGFLGALGPLVADLDKLTSNPAVAEAVRRKLSE